MRGDVPAMVNLGEEKWGFSPHARGCSYRPTGQLQYPDVFPACAGMFRFWLSVFAFIHGFPRMRGDVPGVTDSVVDKIKFSPHARGCSARLL